jgi:transmembrane sensor
VLVQERQLREVEQELTWRSGILTFHDTPLAVAVAEFNRYNERKIVIGDPAIASLKVGGIFGATQPKPFVHLLEQGFPVQALEQPDQIVLNSK